MKKLIYFGCENLRGFEDTEFNCSSKYKIHFDKNNDNIELKEYTKHFGTILA